MPARNQRNRTASTSRAQQAAALYLRAEAEGDSITVVDVASRYGLTRGAVSAAVARARKGRPG